MIYIPKNTSNKIIKTLHNIYYTHIYIAILGVFRVALFSLKYGIYWV